MNAVPPTRGMGSSSAALVAGLAAGLAFGGKDMSAQATKKLLLQLAADAEGHADNVAPAIYGGFQIAFKAGKEGQEQWITQRVSVPKGMQCVLFIPDDEMSTTEARACLPDALPYKDAIFNISRAAMLVNCFATGQFDPLRYSMDDRLHQQYRTHMFPFEPFIQTALRSGAHGAFLSGAGPTVLAITGGVGIGDPGSDTMSQFIAEAVSEAMIETGKENDISGTVHISSPSTLGMVSVGTAKDGSILWSESVSRFATGGSPLR